MNYLIIWQDVPERTRIFVADELTPEEVAKLELCHNHLLGCDVEQDVEEALTWLSELLMTPEPIYDSEKKSGATLSLVAEPYTIIVTGIVC